MAGKRAGMKSDLMGDEENTRSGLFFHAIRIIKEMREHEKRSGRTGELIRPRYTVYENVTGAFSSNKGADFQAVLNETIRVIEPNAPDVPIPPEGWHYAGTLMDPDRRWSISWRTHDAQHWGVPQRRKRISVVADYGGATAPKILFDEYSGGQPGQPVQPFSESVPRHTEPRSTERESTAGNFEKSTGACSEDVEEPPSQGLRCERQRKWDNMPNHYGRPPKQDYRLHSHCRLTRANNPVASMSTLKNRRPCQVGGWARSGCISCPSTKQMAWDGTQTMMTLTSSNCGGGQRMPDKMNFTCVLTHSNAQEFTKKVRSATP